MSDKANAIQGNQSSHQGAVTDARNESKNNWQGWWARSIIGFVLLALAWYIAAQDFGFFYKILIAGGVWWLTSVSESKLSKSEEYKEAIWYWPIVVKGSAILMLMLTLLDSGFGKMTERGVAVLEGEAACVANSGSEACTDYRRAQAALDAPQLERERQAQIEQARHEAAIAAASITPPAEAIRTMGCTGRFVDAMNCSEVTLGPGSTIAWEVLRSESETPRCVRYSPNFGLSVTTPGGGVVEFTNDSTNSRRMVMYEVPEGATDVTGERC